MTHWLNLIGKTSLDKVLKPQRNYFYFLIYFHINEIYILYLYRCYILKYSIHQLKNYLMLTIFKNLEYFTIFR